MIEQPRLVLSPFSMRQTAFDEYTAEVPVSVEVCSDHIDSLPAVEATRRLAAATRSVLDRARSERAAS